MAEKIALIGGTGPQGKGLAMRLAQAGFDILVGSRSAERARDKAAEMNARIGGGSIAGSENADVVAEAEYVLLTVPFENAAATLEGLRGQFQEGQVFVDVTVPLSFDKGQVNAAAPTEGSGSLRLRKVLPPHIPFTGAFKTLPAHLLEEIEKPLECDTFVYGDDREARHRVSSMIRRVPGLRPIDVGGLSAAAMVEGMTALAIRVNRRYKSREARFRILGIDPWPQK